MKTLYELFTENYNKELENYQYKTTKKLLIEELKKNYFVGDLKLSTLIDISGVLKKDISKTIDILYNLRNK